MRVAIVDINKEHLELAKKSVGERTSVFAVDVSKMEEWGGLRKKIDEEFGLYSYGFFFFFFWFPPLQQVVSTTTTQV